MLYLRTPHLRGDDVAELQTRLNALGFDAGREDGIFGSQTARALTEFQRNAGLAVDGILGPATLAALDRVRSLAAGSVAAVRERDRLAREPGRVAGRRIYLAAAPDLAVLAISTRGALTARGAHVVVDLEGDDDARVAERANHFHADLCLVLRPATTDHGDVHFFESPRYRSEAGAQLALGIVKGLRSLLPLEPSGHAFPVLRETRMPTVVVELPIADAPAAGRLLEHAPLVARALAEGIRAALESPAVPAR
jgi:N-acetylmuramoyl-L-alanine amidase